MPRDLIRLELLVHLRRSDGATPAASAGLALARRLDAWVTGLHVVPIAAAAFASPEAVAMYVHESDAAYREALASEPAWLAQLQAAGVEGEWCVSQGDTVEALSHASRWCDMVVVERPQLKPDAPTGGGLVSRTVFGACAPVVVVPETAPCRSIGKRIVVAWNRSREAALAIRGALPLLASADEVVVLEGDPGENPFGLRWLPPLDLRAWLARHMARISGLVVVALPDRILPLCDLLLGAAHAAEGDLIVMGAWGHSRITELVLGGTTRHLFQHSDLPLLVSH
jgi:nucleotide-binding universal stress UspA family protein